jgi:hypothetical protein
MCWGCAAVCRALGSYVAQFLSYFQPEVLLPRLFTALTTGLEGSEVRCDEVPHCSVSCCCCPVVGLVMA